MMKENVFSQVEQFLLGNGFKKDWFDDKSATWYILSTETALGLVFIIVDEDSSGMFKIHLDLEMDEYSTNTFKTYDYSEEKIESLILEINKLAALKF